MAITAVILPAFVAAIGFGMDVGNFYFNYYKAQQGVDAGALAGATCIAFSSRTSCSSGPSSAAAAYALNNGIASTELNPNPPAAPTTDSTYCPTTNCKITVSASRVVSYYFARLAGVNSGTMNVAGVAIGGPINTVSNNPNLMPIGLQYTTVSGFSAGSSVSGLVAMGTSGCGSSGCVSGDWGWLSFDATGHKSVNDQIQNGYTGTVTQTAPGTVCTGSNTTNCTLPQPGAGSSSFSTVSTYRAASTAAACSGQTWDNHPDDSPCAVTVALVDWSLCPAGRCPGYGVPVVGFAELWITDVTGRGSSQNISAIWIGDDVPGGGITGSAPPGVQAGANTIKLIQ